MGRRAPAYRMGQMTLLELIRMMEDVAAAQPSVETIVENDVFKLNSCPDVRYGVFAFVQGTHSGSVDSDFMSWQFNLFYVDRLTGDRSNLNEVQSVGVQTIDNILRTMDGRGVTVGGYTVVPFSQRFSDECAGVYCAVSLSAPVTNTCEEVLNKNKTIKLI